jgi:histidinol phosphatase-like PHP family hydrolase
VDLNSLISALLHALAIVQKSPQSTKGYQRAAAAVFSLDQPIDELVQPDGTLRKIPNVGPSSTRVILELLRNGSSPTVEKAVAASSRHAEVERLRELVSGHFLSRAQVIAALQDPQLGGPRVADYRADFQMHSVWSDGSQTLDAIVEGCLARGYSHCAVTDHSYGLPIARGVSMSNLVEQHREIDRLNERYRGRFRVIKGIEANIRTDGTIDMEPDELAQLELVVAAPHSSLRSSGDQTSRMVTAVSARGVHILGHPRGRKYAARPGVTADWPRVFAAAQHHNVAIEIDGDPRRQDLDYTIARDAVRAGCLIALDSDAHATEELQFAETAIAHARLAEIPREQIVNCWPVERVLDWLRSPTATVP